MGKKCFWAILLGIAIILASSLLYMVQNHRIKVSVVVPVYNTEKYLSQCLDSLKKQTLNEIEFILIDDGSTDASLEIMRRYAADDKRFKIYTQVNSGVGKTRNRGIGLAEGEYVGFVDSDDIISPNYFEKLYNKAHQYDADVAVISNVIKFTGNYQEGMELPIWPYVHLGYLNNLSFLMGNAGQQWDKIYKKEFLLKYNILCWEGYKLLYEDEWFSSQVAMYAKSVAITDEAIYFYRFNPEGITATVKMTYDQYLKGLEFYDALINMIKNAHLETEQTVLFEYRLHEKIRWFKKTYGYAYGDI